MCNDNEKSNKKLNTIKLWPQHLICMRCLNGGGIQDFMKEHQLPQKLERIKKDPDIHIHLQTAFDERGARTELFDVQTKEERKRDLDVLQKLGLVPDSVRTARMLNELIDERIMSLDNICKVGELHSDVWKECPLAKADFYEKGSKSVITLREKSEMAQSKVNSCNEISEANHLFIRAHHLLCMICFIGGDHSEKPLEEDNLYEVWERIVEYPEIPITLTEGASNCMICPPCDGYDPKRGLCTMLCGLKDRRKDLATLQKLELETGDTMPAKELYKLIFERIKDVEGICMYSEETAPEWKDCATHEKGTYKKGVEKGRNALLL